MGIGWDFNKVYTNPYGEPIDACASSGDLKYIVRDSAYSRSSRSDIPYNQMFKLLNRIKPENNYPILILDASSIIGSFHNVQFY